MFLLPVHIQVCIISALARFRVPSVELTKESLLSLLALMPVGSVWGVWMALGSGRSHVCGGWRVNVENSEEAWLHTHARELGRQIVYDVMHRCDESGRKWMKGHFIPLQQTALLSSLSSPGIVDSILSLTVTSSLLRVSRSMLHLRQILLRHNRLGFPFHAWEFILPGKPALRFMGRKEGNEVKPQPCTRRGLG